MNRLLKLVPTIGVILMVKPHQVAAQFDDSPREILKKARDAALAVQRARYAAEYVGTGWIAKHVPGVRGTVIVGKESKWEIAQFRSEVKIAPPKEGEDKEEEKNNEPIELTAGCDGETFFLIDTKTKTVYEDIDPAVMGSHARDVQRVVLDMLASSKPYEKEFEAKDLTIKSIPEIAGERCFETHATVEGREVIWYLAWRDFLPRRIERIYKNPDGEEGRTQLTLTKLEVDPELSGNPFKAEVPPGFKKTNEFAP